MAYNIEQEAIGCTNELYYRNGPIGQDIRCKEAEYVLETIKRCLQEAYLAGQKETAK